MLFESILECNSSLLMRMYTRSCKKMVPLPQGYKIPDFSILSKDDGNLTMEHISRFTAQCEGASHNNYYHLQLFLLSLSGMTFTWYSSLSPNSINRWDDLEHFFHDRFYTSQPYVLVVDLMNN